MNESQKLAGFVVADDGGGGGGDGTDSVGFYLFGSSHSVVLIAASWHASNTQTSKIIFFKEKKLEFHVSLTK